MPHQLQQLKATMPLPFVTAAGADVVQVAVDIAFEQVTPE